MSVSVNRRGEQKLEVFMRAQGLTDYTLQITTNQKVFSPRFKVLTERLIDAAISIGQDIWEANGIRVDSQRAYEERDYLQMRAIRRCNTMLYLINQAARTFHLSGRRTKYWCDQVRVVRDLVRKWRDADRRRYAGVR